MHTKKHCSPFKKSLSYSCLDEKLLKEIRKGLNKIKGIKINSKLKGKKINFAKSGLTNREWDELTKKFGFK